MNEDARRWRILAGGVAAGVAGVLGFAGSTATAEPVFPQPPLPGPATVTQTVTVMPALGSDRGSPPAAGRRACRAPRRSRGPRRHGRRRPAPRPQTLIPATSVTLADYFREKGVKLEPQVSRDFKALNIVLPMPAGWAQVPDPNVPDAFAVIADRVGGDGLYTSNAAVVVYKLVGGDFDPKEAITHGFIDSQQLPAWRSTDASLADFGGMPSSLIEGTYRENAMTLNTSRRHVIATSGPDRYLVSLAVTTTVQQAVAAAERHRRHHQRLQGQRPRPAPPPRAARRRRACHPCRGRQPRRPTGLAAPAGAPRPRLVLCGRMLIAAVLMPVRRRRDRRRSAAGLLTRPRSGDVVRQVLRAVAPTQLAAAAMLAVGGVVALSARPETGLLVVIVCVVGAVATVAAGCWQSAKFVVAQAAAAAACGTASGGCGGGACATARCPKPACRPSAA